MHQIRIHKIPILKIHTIETIVADTTSRKATTKEATARVTMDGKSMTEMPMVGAIPKKITIREVATTAPNLTGHKKATVKKATVREATVKKVIANREAISAIATRLTGPQIDISKETTNRKIISPAISPKTINLKTISQIADR